MSPNVAECRRMSPNVAECRRMSPNVAECRRMSPLIFKKLGIMKKNLFFFQNKLVLEMKQAKIVGDAATEVCPARPVSFLLQIGRK